jgi:hypothetical protein
MTFQLESLESRQFLSSANIVADAGRLLFNQSQGSVSAPQWITLRNTGKRTLSLRSISLGGADANQFTFNRKHMPAALARGASASMKVSFAPTAAAVRGATLDIASNDPDSPVISITLRGLGTAGQFGDAEPSLQHVMDALQIPINVGDGNPNTSLLDGPGASDEVDMPLLKKAGAGPVRISLLAAFSWEFSPVADFGWYRAKGPVTERPLFTAPAGNSQTINPHVTGVTSFDPGVVTFGLYSHWPIENHSDVFTQDALNTWDTSADNQHKVRFYTYRKSSGKVVSNTYVAVMEEGTNSDFQDAVLLIQNVTPYTTIFPPTGLSVSAVSPTSISLTWLDNSNNEANFVIERSNKKSGTYSVIGTVPANTKVFTDTNLTPGVTYFYHVRAINGATTSIQSNRAAATTPH